MNNLLRTSLSLVLALSSTAFACAQDKMDHATAPPKVLVIQREFVKPGKTGTIHEKSESAFVKAMNEAKWPSHYLAANSLSGASRSLFFVGYDSFADWEKDNRAMHDNPTLSAALDSAALADGELLASYDQATLVYRDDLSLRSVNVAQMRYFEITRYVIRPGHRKDWETLVKLYKAGYEKASPEAHWDCFQSVYGADNGGVYLAITPMKSLVETDHSFADSDKFMASMSESDKKTLRDLTAAAIESSQTNLFSFNPKMSYVSDGWVKADPTFWSAR